MASKRAPYTRKSEKNISNWMFHPDYFTEETKILPKCIQRELVVRLSKLKNPILDVKIKNPKIESKLHDITQAYVAKQGRVAENRRILNEFRAEEAESGSESESESENESEDEGIIGVQTPAKTKRQDPDVDHSEFQQWFSSLRQKK